LFELHSLVYRHRLIDFGSTLHFLHLDIVSYILIFFLFAEVQVRFLPKTFGIINGVFLSNSFCCSLFRRDVFFNIPY